MSTRAHVCCVCVVECKYLISPHGRGRLATGRPPLCAFSRPMTNEAVCHDELHREQYIKQHNGPLIIIMAPAFLPTKCTQHPIPK